MYICNHAGNEPTDSSMPLAALSFLQFYWCKLQIYRFSIFPFRKLQRTPRYDSARSKLRLKSDIKTSEPRDLWNVRKVIRPRIKIFVNGNLPWLVRYFYSNSFLRSLAGEAILICFIATAFLHKSNSSAVFFLDRHHLTQCLSRQIFFWLSHFWNSLKTLCSLYRWKRLRI